jgi:hypothetical protein
MPEFIYDLNVDWLDWWHAHPTIWAITAAVAVAATIAARVTRP